MHWDGELHIHGDLDIGINLVCRIIILDFLVIGNLHWRTGGMNLNWLKKLEMQSKIKPFHSLMETSKLITIN